MRPIRALRAILVTAAILLSLKPASSAEFVLVNKSGDTIYQLYLAPCADRHWGHNQLSGTPVWSERAFVISNIAPGCYDIKVVVQPLNVCIISGAALSGTMSWTINWTTLTQAAVDDCSRAAHVVVAGQRPYTPDYHRW